MSLESSASSKSNISRQESVTHGDGLWGWLYQNEVKGKAFVTKGFFLRKRDSEFLASLKVQLSGHFEEEDLKWLVEANPENTRLGFLFLYVHNKNGRFVEGATFSLLLASRSDPKTRDWYEVSLEPDPEGTECKVSLHFAKLNSEGRVKHQVLETDLKGESAQVLSLLDGFVEMAHLDIDRQWENWSHWWFKEAQSLPFTEPTRFKQRLVKSA
jgi:hypothetical protein